MVVPQAVPFFAAPPERFGPRPVMCVGGSIGIWVAGFGSASPAPSRHPLGVGESSVLSLRCSLARSSLHSRTRRAVLYPLRIYAESFISSFFLSLLRRARAQSSINLGKQSRLAGVSSGAQIIGSLPPAVARPGFYYLSSSYFLSISFATNSLRRVNFTRTRKCRVTCRIRSCCGKTVKPSSDFS